MPNKKPIATIIIKRPSWEGVEEAYSRINTANPYDEDLQEKFKQAIIENGKWRGFLQKTTEQKAQEIIERIRNGDSIEPNSPPVWQRYALVGGEPLNEYINYKNFFNLEYGYQNYSNTCALRVSYAFNYGGMPLNKKSKVKLTEGTKLVGADENIYYTGVSGIKELLLENWKRLQPYSEENNRDFYKIFYDHKKEPFKTLVDEKRNIINRTRVEEIREDNLNFLRILKSLEIKGVVTMIIEGWTNAGGHTTLWNGNDFIDETHYLDDERDFVFVRELYFWELKEQTKEIQ